MAYKIKGILNIATRMRVHGDYVGINVKFKTESIVYKANTSGALTIPNIIVSSDVDAMFKNLPLTQFGALNGTALSVTTSGSNVTFNGINPLFMEGQYFEIPQTTVPINSVISGAGIVYMYVQLKLGIPQYTPSIVEIPETGTSAFIGTVTTNSSTVITAHTLSKISRFDEFRASLTQKGGSFPVSSGNPTQTGSISW